MSSEPLTGRDAAEAIGVYVRLGEADARFDGRRLSAAVRSSAGRLRVTAALRVSLRVAAARRTVSRAFHTPRESRPRGRRSGALATASPGRPADPPRPSGAS